MSKRLSKRLSRWTSTFGGWIGPFLRRRWALIVALLAIVVIGLIYAGYWAPWTGFSGRYVGGKWQPAKTLWDWMDLLLVPAILAVGAGVFTWATDKRQQAIEGRRAKAELGAAERRARLERTIQNDRAREATLRAYFDRMADLVKEGLKESESDDPKRSIARAWTLTVARQLDGERKGLLLNFLYEANLIGDPGDLVGAMRKKNQAVIYLFGADLSEVDPGGSILEGIDLEGTNLRRANLSKTALRWANLSVSNLCKANLACAELDPANLSDSDLIGANLSGADLRGADLSGADLRGADLTDAKVEDEQLAQAKSLEGATLPDGTVYTGKGPYPKQEAGDTESSG